MSSLNKIFQSKKISLLIGFIVLIIMSLIFYYLNNSKYEGYQINAMNYEKLEKVKNVDYFQAYDRVLPSYYGFRNLFTLSRNGEIKDNIKRQNSDFAQFRYLGAIDEQNHYRINLVDCTTFKIVTNPVKIIEIYQTMTKNCQNTMIINERIEYLKKNGFVLKESVLKRGEDILVLDDNAQYLFIITLKNLSSYDENLLGLKYELYSKNKYPLFDIF